MKKSFFVCLLVVSILFGYSSAARANDDNRSDQMNPNNDSYWESRGYDDRPDDWEERTSETAQYDNNNHSNQLNPNNDAYWQSRGYDDRPEDWEAKASGISVYDDDSYSEVIVDSAPLNSNIFVTESNASPSHEDALRNVIGSSSLIASRLTASNMKDVYLLGDDGFYHLKDTYSETKVETAIDGTWEPVEQKIDTDLPNKDIGEYDRVKIIQKPNGDIFLLVKLKFDNGFGRLIGFSKELELDFVDGNLEAFSNGKQVTFKYSDSALVELKKELKKLFEEGFRDGTLLELVNAGLNPTKFDCVVYFEEFPNSQLVVGKLFIQVSSFEPMIARVIMEVAVSVPE